MLSEDCSFRWPFCSRGTSELTFVKGVFYFLLYTVSLWYVRHEICGRARNQKDMRLSHTYMFVSLWIRLLHPCLIQTFWLQYLHGGIMKREDGYPAYTKYWKSKNWLRTKLGKLIMSSPTWQTLNTDSPKGESPLSKQQYSKILQNEKIKDEIAEYFWTATVPNVKSMAKNKCTIKKTQHQKSLTSTLIPIPHDHNPVR